MTNTGIIYVNNPETMSYLAQICSNNKEDKTLSELWRAGALLIKDKWIYDIKYSLKKPGKDMKQGGNIIRYEIINGLKLSERQLDKLIPILHQQWAIDIPVFWRTYYNRELLNTVDNIWALDRTNNVITISFEGLFPLLENKDNNPSIYGYVFITRNLEFDLRDMKDKAWYRMAKVTDSASKVYPTVLETLKSKQKDREDSILMIWE